jgi:hypothetical protein
MVRLNQAKPIVFLCLAIAAGSCAPSTMPSELASDEEMVRQTERLRLRVLVAGDVAAAQPLHADDFQLINPVGRPFSREQYLGSLSSGYLDYLHWDPGPIDVRVSGSAATIRYRSELQVSLGGVPQPRLGHWHTDYYEKRDGRWQVVWSQATEIK